MEGCGSLQSRTANLVAVRSRRTFERLGEGVAGGQPGQRKRSGCICQPVLMLKAMSIDSLK